MKKAELILHPVRLRMIQAFVGGSKMTAQQLQDRLGDVPQATLYRHLKKLVDAGVLVVAEEIPNRGTLEKVYMLPERAAEISEEELRRASPDDHLVYFMNFLASMIGEFGRYIQRPGIDLVKDGVGYRQYAVHLSDEENMELLMSIRELLVKAMQKEPAAHRRRRLIGFIDFPEA
jgi:DNA-binding transcriptional ArsR family regulator